MTEAKHTPGPWAASPKYLSEVERGDGKTIASCWHYACVDAHVVLEDVADCSLEESAANARLIAAAPDLLDALERSQAALNPLSGLVKKGSKLDQKYVESVRDDIRAAIAKARGQA